MKQERVERDIVSGGAGSRLHATLCCGNVSKLSGAVLCKDLEITAVLWRYTPWCRHLQLCTAVRHNLVV